MGCHRCLYHNNPSCSTKLTVLVKLEPYWPYFTTWGFEGQNFMTISITGYTGTNSVLSRPYNLFQKKYFLSKSHLKEKRFSSFFLQVSQTEPLSLVPFGPVSLLCTPPISYWVQQYKELQKGWGMKWISTANPDFYIVWIFNGSWQYSIYIASFIPKCITDSINKCNTVLMRSKICQEWSLRLCNCRYFSSKLFWSFSNPHSLTKCSLGCLEHR